MLYPVPEAATAEIVALVPPVFLIVSVWLELCPTVTFVNVKLVGDAVRVAGGATAVPVKGIDKLGFDAFDVTVTAPGKLPTAVGANVTLNDMVAPGTKVRSLGDATRAKSLRWARMCYDHLAGAVGVSLTEALIGRGLLLERDGAFLMTAVGTAEFGAFGLDVGHLERRTRPLLRPCLDWSERRYHLAGSLGAALTAALAARGWIATREASRIVTVTQAGQDGLREWLGIDLAELRAAA